VKNLAHSQALVYGSKGTGFLQVCRITRWNRYKHGKSRTVVQQWATATTTTLSNNNALLSLTTNTFQRMPKNPTTKAPTKAVSTVGPYQVQGGLKGSGSSSSQERGGKPTGTSSVSRSKSSSQQQNDGRPKSSSSGGSKQQDHGITARPGEQISSVYNSGTAAVSSSAMHRTSTTSLQTPRAGTPTSWKDPVSTTARTPFTMVATVYSNSNWGLESAHPPQTMAPGSTTPQSHRQGFTHTPLPVGSLVPISIGGRIRINDETSVVTETNNSALYKQDEKDHKKEQEQRMRNLKDYVRNSLFPFWKFFSNQKQMLFSDKEGGIVLKICYNLHVRKESQMYWWELNRKPILEALNRKRNDVTAYLKKHICGKYFRSIVECLNLPLLGSQTVTPILLF
jgi:hypothetical protein